MVVLANGEGDKLVSQLTSDVLTSIIEINIPFYHARASTLPAVKPAYAPIMNGLSPLTDSALSDLIASKALPLDEAARQRRQALAGDYVATKWGIPVGIAQVRENNGTLTEAVLGQTVTLTEVQPGLIFDPQGNSYDINRPADDAPNLPLIKINPQLLPFLLAFYGLCGLVFLSSLFFWPVRAVVQRICYKKTLPTTVPTAGRRWLPWSVAVVILAGLASLFDLFCLAAEVIVPNLVYVPWPRPWADLPWWQFAGLSLPYAALFLTVSATVPNALAWQRYPGGRGIRIYYTLVALALLAFNLAILVS